MANYDSTHTGATIDSAVSQVTDSTTDFNVDSNTLVVDKSEQLGSELELRHLQQNLKFTMIQQVQTLQLLNMITILKTEN